LQIILDKGQEDDWFGAVWIRWAFVVLIVTFVAFIWRQWTGKEPLTDLRVFRYRNFTLGCVLIALFGAAIYGLVTLLPLFYQELMGYTALNAGIAVSPRGLGAIVAMPIIGFLTAKIDNRYMIAFGFGLFGITALWFGLVNLQISQWTFIWAIVLSGFASGSIFVPLATVSMAELRNEEIGNASGLYNLLRNIGGSVGISVVNTIVARHEQLHRNELVPSITAGSSQVQQQLQSYAGALQNGSGSTGSTLGTVTDRAYGVLNATVNIQARLWSYVDDFRYLALVCFLCVPIVFILRRAKAQKGAVSAAH
jgi:MFS transporter, DHA2 family, multidrug resistance protein